MAVEVPAALIVAVVGLIASLTTLLLGLRSIRVEKEKLQTDRERLRIDTQHLGAVIANLEAETKKMLVEADQTRRALLDVEAQKALSLADRRRDVYPELLELVYRLRNGLRDCVESLQRDPNSSMIPEVGGESLYHLTENLYQYRAFIDEETFTMLHQYKRRLQDARVIYDRVWFLDHTAPRDSDGQRYRNREAIDQLERAFPEVDELYREITKRVRDNMESKMQLHSPETADSTRGQSEDGTSQAVE